MDIENMIGKDFETLGQRILYSYLATYPQFKPVKEIPIESQKQMYDFMEAMLYAIYQNPKLIGIEKQQDNCYKNWELNNSNPELIKAMENIESKLVTFIDSLITIGKCGYIEEESFVIAKGNMNLSKQLRQRLEAFGIQVSQDKEKSVLSSEQYPRLFETWKVYADNDNKQARKVSRAIAFIHGKYFDQVYCATEYFNNLIPDTTLLSKLEHYFAENGYILSNEDLKDKTRYSYVKWLKEYSDKETASARIYFNWRKNKQLIFEFKIPRFRLLLEKYSDMESNLQGFIFNHLKTCDGCSYCTQTDKSGKRNRFGVKIILRFGNDIKMSVIPLVYLDGVKSRGCR